MEKNPYEYEQFTQQVGADSSRPAPIHRPYIDWQSPLIQNPGLPQKAGIQRPHNVAAPVKGARSAGQAPKEQRMTKARALELVRKFKQSLVVASIISFGSVSGLIAYHQISTTAVNQTTSGASQSTSSSSSSSSNSSSSNNNTSNSNSSTSSSNGYFNQQGSSNLGSSNSSSSSVSGTSVS